MNEKRYTARNVAVNGNVRSGRSFTKREISIGKKLGIITGTIKHDNLNGTPFWGSSKEHHLDVLRREGEELLQKAEMYFELANAVEREWANAYPFKVMSNGVAVQVLNRAGKKVEIKAWDYDENITQGNLEVAVNAAINEYFGIGENNE